MNRSVPEYEDHGCKAHLPMDDNGVAPNGVGEDPSIAGSIDIIPAVDIRNLARHPIGGHEIDNRLGDVGTHPRPTCQISLHHF